MSDDLRADPSAPATAPSGSLAVAQAVLRSADGSLPDLVGVGRGTPAFLLPRHRGVAAALCRSYNGLRPVRRRWQRSGVALALQLGAGGLVGAPVPDQGLHLPGMPGQGDLLTELGRLLGTPVHAGVGLGLLDAYWKPVLQLVDGSGRPVGFAKVGWTPMTRRLVRTEGDVLENLSGRLSAPIVPVPLARMTWGPLDVVVTAPLPTDSRRLPDDTTADVPEDMAQVDAVPPTRLGELAWWREVLAAADEATAAGLPAGVTGSGLTSMLEESGRLLGDVALPVGLVHGDWVPWNQARRRATGELVVWDWEYADPRAPLGLDAVHARYQVERLLRGRGDAEAFALAHRDAEAPMAVLHAAMVGARRCRAALLGADDEATGHELAAATAALGAALTRAKGGAA
jgi:hypothetical protein